MNLNLLKSIGLCGFVIASSIILDSCKDKSGTSASSSVNPFDTTSHLESQVLSEADRTKLAAASGKSTVALNADALTQRIIQSTDRLYVYCFWNMQTEPSISTVKAFQHISNNFDTTQVKIVFVSFNEQKTANEVSLFIRENQISDETLLLEQANWDFFKNKLKKDIADAKELPIIIMVNKSEEIFQLYNKAMDEKELSALIQPLM